VAQDGRNLRRRNTGGEQQPGAGMAKVVGATLLTPGGFSFAAFPASPTARAAPRLVRGFPSVNRGEWDTKRGLLQCSPIHDDAVHTTELAYQLISHLDPKPAAFQEHQWGEARACAVQAVQQLHAAMKEDA
jgi:hypothetical protein